MFFVLNRLPIYFLACSLVLGGSRLFTEARLLAEPGSAEFQQLAQQDAPAPNSATFRSVPIVTPAYPTNVYEGYKGPYGGYLSGGADVINAQGQFMINQQQAYQIKEQTKQAMIDTRRKNVDEYLYERAVLPTMEDDRERARLENVRRSRNDPPITEIWSGKALNDLLLVIQQQMTRNVRGPTVRLDEDILRRINVTSGVGNNSIGVLKEGGKLSWPLVLRRSDYKADRQKLDQLAYTAYKQAEAGEVDADALDGMTRTADKLQAQLKENVADISPSDYIAAKRFLNDVNSTARALQDPKVSNYVTRKWAARGDTVAELAQEMGRQGLKFAAAVSGDETAYTALHRAMVAYYMPPTTAWDPTAK